MPSKDTTMRVQALSGVWETVGVERLTGVRPENVSLSSDEWGSSSASCELHRLPRAQWPDISAFTPVEFEIGGVVVWSGRVKETPTRDGSDRVMTVSCEGWQYHLDDDLTARKFVHRKLADWRDCRSFLGEDLTKFRTAGQVTASDGAVTLGWPKGAQLQASEFVGIKLDLGPNNTCAAIGVEIKGITGPANSTCNFWCRCSDSETWENPVNNGPFADTALSVIGTNPNLYEGNMPTPSRYVSIGLWQTVAVTLTGDVMIQIKFVTTVTDTSYITVNSWVPILTAPTVIKDVLGRASLLLSSDQSQITTTSFQIPELAPDDFRTPREVWQAVNAYHDYVSKIDVQRRPVFKAKPAAPALEVGEWSAMEFEDASANSGQDIYNRVIVSAQAPSGAQLSVERFAAAQAPSTQLTYTPDIQATNPSFDVNTTGWSSNQALTRDTTTFDTSPAALSLGWSLSNANFVTGTTSWTMKTGITYVVQFRIRSTQQVQLQASVAGYNGSGIVDIPALAWTTLAIAVTSPTALANPSVTLKNVYRPGNVVGTSFTIWVDSVRIYQTAATLIDRRGFRRTKVLQISNTLPDDGIAAGQLGDKWLANHRTTPFRGSVSITGDQSARAILAGNYVPAERLLLMTTEMLRFSDRVDPDTGAQGRDGRMAAVTYTPANDTASISIDSSRASFEALLARLAVVSGSPA